MTLNNNSLAKHQREIGLTIGYFKKGTCFRVDEFLSKIFLNTKGIILLFCCFSLLPFMLHVSWNLKNEKQFHLGGHNLFPFVSSHHHCLISCFSVCLQTWLMCSCLKNFLLLYLRKLDKFENFPTINGSCQQISKKLMTPFTCTLTIRNIIARPFRYWSESAYMTSY